jgi:hypothetical protein
MIVFNRVLLKMGKASEKNCRESKTHFVIDNFFSQKIVPFMRNVEKYFRTRQAVDDNIIWYLNVG